ncbi:carbon-phosphorus lyase subunit PhnH [Salipiger pallidus]|uniref:Carbon-phosphorus lyase subunit PhnH n=1 Tax=Salipiger pallidus TaxID=1775170 RepID=A0A8J2ZH57_9RHOB|nr:phosphonate C-P lyase system protein PhnH [Salipiger pallidus]GGG62228.1 carbon-phosphorus lyase subunit PhnH [Salipiger pallidus]
MQPDVLTGGFADPAPQSARAFRAALQAMAMPGTIHEVSGASAPAPLSAAAAVLLLTLCDRETLLHLAPGHDVQGVRDWVAFHIGAPIVPAGEAMFALGTWEALASHDAYAIGTPEYPDRAATLIVEVASLDGKGARLTGPGIRDEAFLPVPDVAAFRANARRFPLGWDAMLTCGPRLAAIPRSTTVEDITCMSQ